MDPMAAAMAFVTGLTGVVGNILYLAIGLIVVWIVWRLAAIVHEAAEWGRDRVAFERGLVRLAAKGARINLDDMRAITPTREMPESKFNMYRDKGLEKTKAEDARPKRPDRKKK